MIQRGYRNQTMLKIVIKFSKKMGLEIQDFSIVKYRGRKNTFVQRTVKVGILQVKVVLKLTKMTK